MSGLIQAGRLTRTITLQTATATQDPSTGEALVDWTAIAESLPAEWLPANTREAYQAQQRLAAYIDGVFRIRYRARPQPDTQRIVFDGRTYDIKPPIELGLREGWDIPAVARAEGP
jgi:SPP1 family predicted phage head-tail adaptor